MYGNSMETAVTAVWVSTTAPAKINLTLEVRGPRRDGYHEIRSIVMGVDLCDRVRLRPVAPGGIRVACNLEALAHPANLAARAAARLAETTGRACDIALEIEKHIPVGAGLGGGSSDAAAALRLYNTGWDLGLSRDRLAAVGSEVGSDVPLFFFLPCAFMSGRGERVEAVQMEWSGWVVLVFLGEAVSTEAVYGRWCPEDRLPSVAGRVERIAHAKTAEQVSVHLFNDLTAAVHRECPGVARSREAISKAGLGTFQVTGAGSTLYRLYDDHAEARRTANDIEQLELGLQAAVAKAPIALGPITNEE